MSRIGEGLKNIGTESGVTIGILVLVVGLTAYITSDANMPRAELQAVGFKLEAINVRLTGIESKLEDRWTRNEMMTFAERLGDLNPTVRIPPVRER